MNAFKAFFCSHPEIVKAIEALEHVGLDAAEDLVLTAVGQKFGVLAHLFPVETILDGLKAKAETAIDGELESIGAPDPAPAAQNAPPPAPAAAPGVNPQMAAFQARRAAQLADANPPMTREQADAARDEQAENPGT